MNDYNENDNGASGANGDPNPYRPNWQTPGDNSSGGQDPREGAAHSSGYYPSQGAWNNGANDYQSAAQAPSQQPREPEEPYRYNLSDYEPPQDPDKKPPKKGKKGLAVFFSIIGVILAVSLVFFAGYGIYIISGGQNFIAGSQQGQEEQPLTPDSPAPQLNISNQPQTASSAMSDGGLSNEEIAARAAPSVVCITNFQSNSQFGIVGEGSGIIMNKEGYIVTNAHVIEGNTGLRVTLPNEESYNASQVGIDKLTDLAVIKLEADPMPDLPVAEFGDSNKLSVGERVIAIGNAGGSEFSGSVTGGMISALHRQISTDSGARLNVLQTDAAINPGNSGGALVNKYAQVIGINSAKLVKEGYEGLGFAIPINNAKPIVDDLIKNGRVTGRPRLGIKGIDVDNIIAQYMGLPGNVTGIMLAAVDPTCNISKQGVVAGDVLTMMNGEPIESMTSLQNDLIELKPGDVVEFEVYRPAPQTGMRGRTFTIKVTLDEDNGTTGFAENEQQQQQQDQQQQQQGGQTIPGFPFFPFY